MTERDKTRLIGIHPKLVEAVTSILASMDASGHSMMVVQGVRTAKEQAALYAKGRTAPGAIVTMKDGIRHPSNHQPHADHLGHAVDCAFAGVPDPFAESLPWESYGLLVESHGLTWGGRWTHPHDSPHAELP